MAVSRVVMPAVSQSACVAASSAQPSSSSSTPSCHSTASLPLRKSRGGSIRQQGSSSSLLGCVNGFQSKGSALVRVQAGFAGRAMATDSAPVTQYDKYEVELEKPWGLKFYKGTDGGTYVDAIQPGSSADRSGLITPGDRVLATSAVFGNEIWPAAEYGRTMYTVRQRIGTLLLKMENRNGVREGVADKEELARERNAGSIGDRVREIQMENYLRKVELKNQRAEELGNGLKLYRAAKYEEALERFETVLGLKPDGKEEGVASYNVACCYSKLGQVDGGLQALEEALEAGFDDYKAARTDPDLETLRASPKFKDLINKYDEPFINENAVNALKNVFGFFKK